MGGQQPDLSSEERAALGDLASLIEANTDRLIDIQQELMADLPVGAALPATDARTETAASVADLRALADGADYGQYLETRRTGMAQMAEAGLSFATIVTAVSRLRGPLVEMIRAQMSDPTRVYRTEDVIDRLIRDALTAAGEVFATVKEDHKADEYRSAIRRLSTPVVRIWDGILLLPVIGIVDSDRARQMMEQLLNRIAEERAHVVILDVTGVPTLDTAVADHLIKTTRAASLLGARTLLVGISPEVAQTVVRLGVSLADMDTHPDLRSGLEQALACLGQKVTDR